ncbi:multidrug effflux MFS transporter [Azospirillum picis]|uniref:Bcr/CflA family efflux transporter n=1 Tax=Azospirillum picis TaxID=488438 RepID=A0ABU0MLU3_9PROT|nr:multidrug effflux MFS transporter [Azospirillum picis]MBP2301061.1 DHA1 family bicyclomycin/chloramphenicol resistance-like MFS transporter [Azospirillum picis]MDQ0534319.1 DHA1 family bicyclomycin/chloramphenicol resistance-like MFS transporter [Azospirillum picis]
MSIATDGRPPPAQAAGAAVPPLTPASPPRPHVPLWLLALLTFSGTLAMHIFVPALPVAAADLGAGIASMQLTVSLYVLGLAFGQLVYGPLADRFGRRPVLMAALVLYTAAGLAAALAPGVHALIAARLFQALGGCAGLVLGRAIVRDVSPPHDAARRLALMNLMVTVGPGLAPIAGGLLAGSLGWRSIFVALCGLGLVNFLCTWRLLPETGGGAGRMDLPALGRNYRSLLLSPAFLGYAVGGGFATTSLYAFIAAAPFIVVEQEHRPPQEIGFHLAVLFLGIWLGSMLASRLVSRAPIGRVMILSNLLSLVAALALLAVALSGQLTPVLTVLPMFVFALGMGTAAPMALTRALGVNARVIGSASGLYGCTQMAVGALCTAAVGIGGNPALAAALVLTASGLIAQTAFHVAERSRSRQEAGAPV